MHAHLSHRRQAKVLGRNCSVTERTGYDRSVEVEMHPRLYNALMTPGGRFLLIVAAVVLILAVAVGGHIYGRVLASRDMIARDDTIQQLRAEGLKLKAQATDQNAKLTALQTKLTNVQAALDAIVPSENTYNFSPNQSMIVAGGRLTVGLIGAPANGGININVNGKQQLAAAGDVIHVAVDPSTNCQVTVQSFDMFKAMIFASCPTPAQNPKSQ
jgi:hypothetical protein